MGRKAERSGVKALDSDRIQFDFTFDGKRYRPREAAPRTEPMAKIA